jgi:hypothetical protein
MRESNFVPSKNNGVDELTIDLARAKLLQEKCFTKIVRFLRWQQKKPASGSAEQIRRDIRLCELLTEYDRETFCSKPCNGTHDAVRLENAGATVRTERSRNGTERMRFEKGIRLV